MAATPLTDPPSASARNTEGQPLSRPDHEVLLRRWMDDNPGERLPILNAGEAHVVASLLDELAAVYAREPLGILAREMAVRINDRLGI